MATAQEIIAKARSYVGVKEQPANSNNCQFNTSYYNKPVSGSAYPWCCVYLWYVFKECNASELFYGGKKTALCMELGNWFKAQNSFYTSNPQVGDIVFFKFSGNSRWCNHVGIISKVHNDDSIDTIEGNTSSTSQDNGGAVMERVRRSTKNIVGYGRPKYASVEIPAPKQNSPVQTTSVYPQRGIDISGYQTNLNYQQLKQNGVQFAILKIVRKDLGKDKGYDTHLAGCDAAGIPVTGVYNYSYATTVEKAKIDALKVLEHLAGRKVTVWLDVEDNCQKNLGERLPQIINAYQAVIEGAGLKFGVYTGLSFYNSFIKPYITQLNTKNFWIARYYNGDKLMLINDELNNNYKPSIVGNLIAWQFSSSGVITGSSGKLDLDIVYSPISQTIVNNNTPTTKKVQITAQSGLRIRSTPDTSVSNNILGAYKYNDVVDVTDYNGSWWRTDRGFISKTYTKII